MSKCSSAATAVLLAALALTTAFGQAAVADDPQVPVRLSLPSFAAGPGDQVLVPVRVSDVTGLNVLACDLLITYDARIVTAEGIIITGTMTHRWSQAHRVGFVEGSQDTMGMIDIALATANRIPSGSGTLLNIRFSVSPTAQDGQTSPLVITEAILNDRNPGTTVEYGSITVTTQLLGDFNGDCVVNFRDFLLFMQHYGSQEGDPKYDSTYDLNGDGKIDFGDFLILVQYYGKTCDDL